MRKEIAVSLAVALATSLSLVACAEKASLDDTQAEMVTVEGRKYEVRLGSTGTPDEYRMLIVRGTLVINADSELEAHRAQNVYPRFIERTCKGRPHQIMSEGLSGGVNYYVLFRCLA
ncbi:MAG: hypothetical protein EXR12_15430 [Rhodospirillaceae bacterium]|nr:hypothetical protein [Rhodospirillaceae bacterium]